MPFSSQRSPFSLFARLAIVCFALLTLPLAAAGPEKPLQTDWPEFRGPWKNGHVAQAGDTKPIGLPLEWSETKNVKWKVEIPEKGWSTPAISKGRIWLTAATIGGNDFFVLCLDAETGKILINKKIFHCDDPEPLGNNVNSYASPSAVIEKDRVYVHFGTYGTACLNESDGKVLWERSDLHCRHYRGSGSSPVVFENLLILSFDGVDVQYLIALDKKTGKNVWKTDRSTVWTDLDDNGQPKNEGDLRKSFSTPLIIDLDGKPLMLSLGSSTAFGYDPRTGREIWKITLPGHTSSVQAVFGKGLAYVATGHGKVQLWALRVDGQGDVTNTHVVWKSDERTAPEEPSPLLVDDLLFMVSKTGIATCLEAATGKQLWSERTGGTYYASPIFGDGRLYFSNVQGRTTVLKAGPVYEKLAVNELDSGFMASPAVTGKALILRTKTDLYRIEIPASK